MYVRVFKNVPDLETLREAAKNVDLTKGSGSYISPSEDTLPHFAPLFPLLKLLRAGIVVLQPSQQLVGHTDPWNPHDIRIHIPLYTNDACWCFHSGAWVQLEEGKAYEMSPAEFHGAVNWGHSPRMHLMLDYQEELC